MKLIIIAVLGSVLITNAEKVTYENFKIYNVVPKSDNQVKFLSNLMHEEGYDFWTEVIQVDSKVRLMVYPEIENEFVINCASIRLKAEVSIPNLQQVIEETMKPTTKSTVRNVGSFNWEAYHTIEEIYAWMDELEVIFPKEVTVVTIGSTIEGRPIRGIVIDLIPDRGNTYMTGMIEGGIHAREWISPATVTWIIKEFLTSTDAGVQSMARNFVWHIFPVINPDGYAYTFSNNRMWRKNRNPSHFTNCTFNNDLSNGVDLNRNFDFSWMSTGASLDACTEIFAGSSGSSELETRAISNYVLTLKEHNNLMYYFAFHSYSQMILVPYSHVAAEDKLTVHNYADLFEIAVRGADKLTSVHGTPYTVGVSAEILYPVSGSSFDWVKGVAGVPITYLFELRDTGEFGFLLPTEQIIPNNEEIMACLVEMDRVTMSLGYHANSANIAMKSISLLLSTIAFLIMK